LRRSATQEGFICVLCLDILMDPVTLECGHTCCRQCFVAYIEDKLRGLVLSRVDCPTGARCQLPIKVPAINLTLKNTIEANHAERVAARRSEEGRLSAADMQQRAQSIERLAPPALDHAQRWRTRPYMSVIICLWLAFLAGRSSLPTSLRSSLRTYVDEAPWSGEQLYEWVQADVSNRRLFMWETSVYQGASTIMDARLRYNIAAPQLPSPLLRAEPLYKACVMEATEFDFWAAKLFFPHECEIQTMELIGPRVGSPWAVWLRIVQLKSCHMQRLSIAVQPFDDDPRVLQLLAIGRGRMGARLGTVIALLLALCMFVWIELAYIWGCFLGFHGSWLMANLLGFVPIWMMNGAFRCGLIIGPLVGVARHTRSIVVNLRKPLAHTRVFFSLLVLLSANHGGVIDVHVPLVAGALLVYRILVSPITWTWTGPV